MKRALPPFYLIVGETSYLERCLQAGVRLVQLRLKDKDTREIRSEILAAKALCDHYGATLVINDYWELAMACACQWVHLGQEDLLTVDIPALRRAQIKIGISTHDLQELTRARALEPNYIALGPIYETKLKKMKWAPQGLQKLTQWKTLIGSTPLVAIGGLTPERAPSAYSAGADSIAVVTDILTASDPKSRCREWLALSKDSDHVPL